MTGAVAAAATTAGGHWRRGAGRPARCRASRGEHRQEPNRVDVAVRARRRVIRFGHRPASLEGGVARTAAVLVERHPASVDGSTCLTRGVSQVQTLPGISKPELDEVTETGEPLSAHIVKTEPGESATAKVMEARIYGTPIEALCGHVWVPSRDPKQLPMCEKCKAVYEMYRAFNDGLNESPQD